jgi:hypothetical protein
MEKLAEAVMLTFTFLGLLVVVWTLGVSAHWILREMGVAI